MRAASTGDTVGPYRLVRAIGAGGSARVDLACLDRAYGFQRSVVLKRPLEHLRGDARATASLEREARICGRLAHPHLVGILDAGEHDGALYLALEYVPGGSLRSLLQSTSGGDGGAIRRPPLAVALAIAVDVARGLHHAHELRAEDGSPLGLVHRDVSPGNILIGADGAVKLADFGIAVETRVSTLTGSMHGTVAYMAPEQCRGHAFDRRADVFSLGVILYELVTGARLFAADNDVATLHRVLSAAVTPPHRLVPDLPPGLEDIILAAIAHDAERRTATAGELADALEALAARAAIPLTARAIARWVAAGAPGASVVAGAVAPHADPPPPSSLVELIAAIPPDEPAPTFDLGGPAQAAPPLAAGPSPSRRRRRIALAGLAAGLAAGIAVLALSSTTTTATSASQPAPPAIRDEPTPPPKPAPPEPDPTPAPTTRAAAPDTPPPPSTGDPTTPAAAPNTPPPPTGDPTTRAAPPPAKVEEPVRVVRPVVRVRPSGSATRTPDVVSRTPDSPPRTPDVPDLRTPDSSAQGSSATPGAGAERGSGAKARVEWKPDILLPTDATPGSGRPRR